jgi:hypothetical protein
MKKLLLLAIGVIALAANPVYAQKYPIRISSRDAVGQKTSITSSASVVEQMSMSQGGRVVQTQAMQYQVSFEGRAEVLAVDMKERAYRVAYTVDKFTKTENGITTDVFKPGTVIVTDGSQERDKQIAVRNGSIDNDARETAGLVLPAHPPDSVGDDDVFGTKEPKGIGDKWPINSVAAAEDLKRSGIASASTLTGTVSVESKGTVDGKECLNLAAELNADGIVVNNGPPGFVPETGNMRATFRGCIPTDPAVTSRKEEAELVGRFRVRGSAGTRGEGISLEVTSTRKTESLITQTR